MKFENLTKAFFFSSDILINWYSEFLWMFTQQFGTFGLSQWKWEQDSIDYESSHVYEKNIRTHL